MEGQSGDNSKDNQVVTDVVTRFVVRHPAFRFKGSVSSCVLVNEIPVWSKWHSLFQVFLTFPAPRRALSIDADFNAWYIAKYIVK